MKSNMLNIIVDWVEVFKLLKKNKKLRQIVCFSLADPLTISFVNIMLVPLVSNRYTNAGYMVSLFDGFFAIGAIFSILVISKGVKVIGIDNLKFLGIINQRVLFILLLVNNNKIYSVFILFMLGIVSSVSVVVYQTLLQKNTIKKLS